MFLVFKNGLKSIQTAGYNGVRTVCKLILGNTQNKDVSIYKMIWEIHHWIGPLHYHES